MDVVEIANAGELDGRRELNQLQKFWGKVGFITMVFSASGILWTSSVEHGVSAMHLFLLYMLLVLGSGLVLLSAMLPLAAGMVRPARLVALALSLFFFGGNDELFL